MPEIVSCPDCGKKLRVPDDLLGKEVKCPSCAKMFWTSLPETDDAPPAKQAAESREQDHVEEEPRASRRPAGVRRARDDRDEDEDEEEYEDRPRRRKRRRRDYEDHRGGLILTLGILSLTLCGIFTGIPAWVMGSSDLAAMRAGRMDPAGEGLTKAGKICGMINVILSIVGCGFYLIFFLLFGALAARR